MSVSARPPPRAAARPRGTGASRSRGRGASSRRRGRRLRSRRRRRSGRPARGRRAASRPHGARRRRFLHAGVRRTAVKEVILTAEGYKKLQQEIEFLSNDKRREVAERIRIAREFGDIAENAEYDDAKNEQAHLEARIALLEERLRAARVVTKKEIKSGEVSIGTKVRLRDMDAKQTIEYHIVGSAEAAPAE